MSGHALECRINAEDPADGFRPAPGTLTALSIPSAEGVRFDSHVRAGYRIPAFYDSMVGKLIVHGPDRASAVDAMSSALESLSLEGVPTTIGLHAAVMRSAGFRAGNYNCNYLVEHPELLESE
jgi:acetyl-CoA carboxylase biotin carboxylase subunit